MNSLKNKTYDMFTKSDLPHLFRKYGTNLEPTAYQAAAQVFPMRVNSHVADDLIDWYVSLSAFLISH